MRREYKPTKCGSNSSNYPADVNATPHFSIFTFVYRGVFSALFFKLSIQSFVKFFTLHFFYRNTIHSSEFSPLLFHEFLFVEYFHLNHSLMFSHTAHHFSCTSQLGHYSIFTMPKIA